ncbi:hypothetical protein ASF21_12915 [Arthrobacter sp. Leaf234]|uniref:hypothetical protein n=1 Tax=Arthrobacter sp. Leaf234 TaxID=1736303 RepID=UPI0006F4C44A|nr:hypothetical protein [Arthrobacter sp. Leaf234]KQN99703.1 hypothetical protein ASF21_12915 [Arthrobacter sp. Leaf234]
MGIESHFYDTIPGQGINEIEWSESARSRGPIYGVSNPSELLCTAHPSTPYAVNISPAPSGFWGHGVWDTSDSTVTVVCTPPALNARRFDLITPRRDWTPTGGGPTTITKVQGTSSRSIPTGRETSPGEVDDQPLWLVEWLGGETQPQSITDLRVFGGGGGGQIAMNKMALEYLKAPGARVTIDGTLYQYEPIGNGVWDWVIRDGIQHMEFWTGSNGFGWAGGGRAWDVGPLSHDANYAVNAGFAEQGPLSGSIRILRRGYYEGGSITTPRTTNVGNAGVILRNGRGDVITTGNTSGYLWEISTTFPRTLFQAGEVIRFGAVSIGSGTVDTRVRIDKVG